MADNYIERQKEDYEARKAALENKKKTGKKKKKNTLSAAMQILRDEQRRECM